MNAIEYAKHDREYALKNLVEQMERAAETFVRCADEMRANAKRAGELGAEVEATGKTAYNYGPAEVAGAAASFVHHYPTNVRMDLLVKYATDYSAACARVRALTEPTDESR